ncbi:hypothetical protein [Azorhizobium oxalatiphilum]|uniref:hypothetical protein n=1 Tax=Azorhizobium oxalatiphilum TaxID=980631 RepID=UPI001AEE73CB|nr:hypothetical protein [Azorhizobium oxalatiphilum]
MTDGAMKYAEVWGDTVDLKDLAKAVVIGGVIALACYLIAGRVLMAYAPSAQIARTYAMLFGLLGCIGAGALCARLFAPKRDLSEGTHDDAWRDEALAALAEGGRFGRTEDLPAVVQAEMKELGLYDTFVRYEAVLRQDEAKNS